MPRGFSSRVEQAFLGGPSSVTFVINQRVGIPPLKLPFFRERLRFF